MVDRKRRHDSANDNDCIARSCLPDCLAPRIPEEASSVCAIPLGGNYIRKRWAKPLPIGFSVFFAIVIAFGAMVAFVYSGKSLRY